MRCGGFLEKSARPQSVGEVLFLPSIKITEFFPNFKHKVLKAKALKLILLKGRSSKYIFSKVLHPTTDLLYCCRESGTGTSFQVYSSGIIG